MLFFYRGALEEEKTKNQKINNQLDSHKVKVTQLEDELEDTKVRSEVRDKIEATIQVKMIYLCFV